jgi:pimeloyl-ACP methyl ester carboxylesterase
VVEEGIAAGSDDAPVGTVTSADGTTIGYHTSGDGRPLVLVHGTGSVDATWIRVLPYLEGHATLYAMSRRGRGTSGDGDKYHVAREFEDVAAVVDVAAAMSGTTVDVLGHSFGGLCALGAATLTPRIRRLVVYESPWKADQEAISPDLADRLEDLLAAGDRTAALETLYLEEAGMAKEELAGFRELPGWWDLRLTMAHTLPRELRSDLKAALTPRRLATISAPILMLLGSETKASFKSDTEALATALPDARISILDEQGHLAHLLDPETFAERVIGFLSAG